jgi:hypothetical protein
MPIDNNEQLNGVQFPDEDVVDYVISKTKYTDRMFVAAAIVAFRHNDPKVPAAIGRVLNGARIAK